MPVLTLNVCLSQLVAYAQQRLTKRCYAVL